MCRAQYNHNFKPKIAEMAKRLRSLKAVCGRRPNSSAEQCGERSALRFAANAFSRQEKPRGLDGFASSMCIPVGRPYSTCHRFGFSHSFLKPPSPMSHLQERTRANCQKYTDSNQNISATSVFVSWLGRGQRRFVHRSLNTASEHSKRQLKRFFQCTTM